MSKAHYFYMPNVAEITSPVKLFPEKSKFTGFLTFADISNPASVRLCWPASQTIGETGCCGSFSVLFGHYIPGGDEIMEIFKSTSTALLHIHTFNERYGVNNPLAISVELANKIHPKIATVEIVHQQGKDYILQLTVKDIPAWNKQL